MPLRKILRVAGTCVVSFIISLLIFTTAKEAQAVEMFSDEFDVVNEDRWVVLNETDIPVIYSGEALFRNVNATESLFFQNTVPLETEGIAVEIRFRYVNNYYNFGSGIAFNDNPVPLRKLHNDPDADDWTIFVWPLGGSKFGVFSSVCLSNDACSFSNLLKMVTGEVAFGAYHVLRVEYINNTYSIYLDGENIGQTVTTDRDPRYIWLGNPMTTGGVSFSNFYVDYVNAQSLGESFPYYSQLEPEWAGEEYDEASEWALEGERGIDRWGCALTSAAMIFKNFEVNHPVTSEESNPQVLNDWLNARPDGYIRNGLVNWIALTKYAKESESAGNSPTALEFKKDKNIDVSSVDLPTILGLPGHFVVAHDEDADNFDINDPADDTNDTLSKTADILSSNTYIPSDTDLSYMMFVVDQETEIRLFDSNNDPVGEIFLEDPILDGVDDDGYSGETLKTLLFPKPDDGVYILRVSNPGSETQDYELDLYLYDSEGGVAVETFEISMPGEFEEFYEIDFNKNSVDDSSVEYTISSLKNLLWEYYDLGEIKTRGTAQSIDNFLKYAERFAEKFPWFQDRMLVFAKKYIQKHTSGLISEDASGELIARIDSLLN